MPPQFTVLIPKTVFCLVQLSVFQQHPTSDYSVYVSTSLNQEAITALSEHPKEGDICICSLSKDRVSLLESHSDFKAWPDLLCAAVNP